MMKPKPAWISVAERVCDFLQENQDKMDFLREIDRNIVLVQKVSLEQLVRLTLNDLRRFSHATRGHVYVDAGDELLLLATTATQDSIPKSLPLFDLSQTLGVDEKQVRFCSSEELRGGLQFFSASQTLLLVPVWHGGENRFGIIILESQHPSPVSPFRDPSAQDFANIVSSQLGIGLRVRFAERRTRFLDDVRNEFFKRNLESSECFEVLAAKAADFLPSFDPFMLSPRPEVQVLLYEKDGDYFVIVGTTGSEILGTRVKVEDSVCGLLIKKPKRWPIVLGDPYQDKELKPRYKAYLGKRNRRRVRTELAVPVRMDDHIIAVLNLESPVENAFKKPHVDAAIDLCDTFAPIVRSLHAAALLSRRRQMSVVLAESSYWRDAGKIFRHNTDTRLTAIRISAANAMTALKHGKDEEITPALSRIQDDLVVIRKMEEQFCEQFTNYANFGQYSIRTLVSKALNTLFQRVERRIKEVKVCLPEGPDFEVYCSPLLSLHVYNMIDNAVYWTQVKMDKDPTHQGKVIITIGPGDEPEPDQERELNKTCKVEIRDNGPGVPEDIKKRIFEPGMSLKPQGEGWGYALFAAKKYLNDIHGDIIIDSCEGEWFKCVMTLRCFKDRLHRPGTIPF